MIKRKFDKILSEGKGKQLLWLLVLCLLCIAGALAYSHWCIKDVEKYPWQYVIGMFLDSGVFGCNYEGKDFDFFSLILSLLSVFLFSALLVSVFTSVFENIASSVKEGDRRYRLKNHILILGGGHHLKELIEQYKDSDKTIVVMSPSRPKMDSKVIYYHGKIDDYEQLKSANVATADTIYIIGENGDPAHDAVNLRCLDLVKGLCKDLTKDIHCYITLKEQVSLEVFHYYKLNETGHLLLVDVINDYEYAAEQLLVNTDFLPVIKKGEDKASHLIILGIGPIAQAVAYTAAHISHYPTDRKTKITFISEGMRKWMDDMVVARPGLFELSVYKYISADGTEENHAPAPQLDYLDVEWEFVDTYESSALSQKILNDAVMDKSELVTVYSCHKDPKMATASVLHLPRAVYENAYNIAVNLVSATDLIARANQSGMYGKITIFGGVSSNSGTSLIQRSKYGKRVNFVYDQAYGNPPSKDEEEAWYKIPEAHKYSSIYCANAMFLRRKCFDIKGPHEPLYEAEHRRWIMSALIMGYHAGEVTDKEKFIHADIMPYENLPESEQKKDKILIDAMKHILSSLPDYQINWESES